MTDFALSSKKGVELAINRLIVKRFFGSSIFTLLLARSFIISEDKGDLA